MNKPHVSYSAKAQSQLEALDCKVKTYLMRSIECQCEFADKLMTVNGMTIYLPDHIYRCAKMYATPPGFRAILHLASRSEVVIDSVCRRDLDPYGDSR